MMAFMKRILCQGDYILGMLEELSRIWVPPQGRIPSSHKSHNEGI